MLGRPRPSATWIPSGAVAALSSSRSAPARAAARIASAVSQMRSSVAFIPAAKPGLASPAVPSSGRPRRSGFSGSGRNPRPAPVTAPAKASWVAMATSNPASRRPTPRPV